LIYKGCLEWDPEKRMTPKQALEHKWLKNKTPNLALSMPQRNLPDYSSLLKKQRIEINNNSFEGSKRNSLRSTFKMKPNQTLINKHIVILPKNDTKESPQNEKPHKIIINRIQNLKDRKH